MFWFIAGVSVHCIAILAIIGNALYDAYTMKDFNGRNIYVNLIGFILGVIVLIAFILKGNGKMTVANLLLWIPAIPLLVVSIIYAIYIFIVLRTNPDWK
jgi:hypothetical protein